MKRFGLAAAVVIGIAILILMPAPKKNPKDEADKNAAVAAIRSRYQPSLQLMSMNPDPNSMDWIGVAYPLCDSKSANCWKVVAYVDVMPQAEKKTIQAEWIIDLSTGKDEPNNTEARLMYSLVEGVRASSPLPPPSASQQEELIPLGLGPNYPPVETVTARALTAAPGAIVCTHLDTVGEVFHLYADHWESSSVGGSSPTPDPSSYGCTLIPPGTKMAMQKVDGVPAVALKMNDGSIVKGVTLGDMIVESKADEEANEAAWKAKTEKQLPKPTEPPQAAPTTQ